jgi:2-polyprenyl-3-methyl-5-hydroxy-6-metoxy-1,4-benzoquinol methylase
VTAARLTSDVYFSYAKAELGERGAKRLRHQMAFLYKGVVFEGKRVLDVGGGSGRHTFYAASRGATSVLTIEPEADGGHGAMHSTFQQWRSALHAEQVKLQDATIQNFANNDAPFDIVLVQDAINHFDEQACIDLRRKSESRQAYRAIFRQLASLVAPGGLVIMSDCSSVNLFPLLGMRNPIDPAIEWHKHQPPEVWMGLAAEVGLETQRVRWSTPARFGRIGAALLGNRVCAFLFTSHFVITMRKAN